MHASIAQNMMGGLFDTLGVDGTWNIDNVSAEGGEICEELRKRMTYVCYFQDVRCG